MQQRTLSSGQTHINYPGKYSTTGVVERAWCDILSCELTGGFKNKLSPVGNLPWLVSVL